MTREELALKVFKRMKDDLFMEHFDYPELEEEFVAIFMNVLNEEVIKIEELSSTKET